MRSNLTKRLSVLEENSGDQMVVVFPLDCFYGVQGALPTKMTQAAFNARAAGGLASFYAEQAAVTRDAFPMPQLHDLPTIPGDGDEAEPITEELIGNKIQQAARHICSSLAGLNDIEDIKARGNSLIDEHAATLSTRYRINYDKTRAIVAAATDELIEGDEDGTVQ